MDLDMKKAPLAFRPGDFHSFYPLGDHMGSRNGCFLAAKGHDRGPALLRRSRAKNKGGGGEQRELTVSAKRGRSSS